MSKRSRFAMVPERAIFQLDETCLGMLCVIRLLAGGPNGRPIRNAAQLIARARSLQPRTVREHARHLADHGIIAVRQEGNAGAIYTLHPETAWTLPSIDRGNPPGAGSRSGHRGRRSRDVATPTASAIEQATEVRSVTSGVVRVGRAQVGARDAHPASRTGARSAQPSPGLTGLSRSALRSSEHWFVDQLNDLAQQQACGGIDVDERLRELHDGRPMTAALEAITLDELRQELVSHQLEATVVSVTLTAAASDERLLAGERR